MYYSDIDEFINTTNLNINNSNEYNKINQSTTLPIAILSELPSYFFLNSLLNKNRMADLIHPELVWTDDKWKEIGKKLGNEIWNSRKIVTEKKSEIRLPLSLYAYHTSFPKFLTGFFDGVIGEIFNKKLISLNYKRKQCGKPLK